MPFIVGTINGNLADIKVKKLTRNWLTLTNLYALASSQAVISSKRICCVNSKYLFFYNFKLNNSVPV